MRHARTIGLALAALILGGCAVTPALSADGERLRVVTATTLLRDLVINVGGERVEAVSLVPDGADPHSYEPSLRDARNAAYADVAFSNYPLLEQRTVMRTLEANLRADATSVSLAQEAVKYSAQIIALVEDINLDTVWLGLSALGAGERYGITRTSEILVSATEAVGPGDVFAYLTGTFGDTEVYFDSSDGFDAASGYRDDTATLPAQAHSHLSWTFTAPGVYELTLAARAQASVTSRPQPVDEATFTFVVGVDPGRAGRPDAVVLAAGHADLAVNLDEGRWEVHHDPSTSNRHTHGRTGVDPFTTIYLPEEVLIEVPARALAEIPTGSQLAFLGEPGTQVYQLPQAVLGRHVHGEIDPHLWQDVRNGMAYVQIIRDTLIEADPAGAREYRDNADAYLAELAATDDYVRERLAEVPRGGRYLVTTHDAYRYLGLAYDVSIAGYVTANPATEPSLSDRRKLSETIRALRLPAVFLEPDLASRTSTLTEVAADRGVAVCPIYNDALDDRVTSYVQMMRFNADSVHACLTGRPDLVPSPDPDDLEEP